MATPVAAQSCCWIPTSSRAWLDAAVQILEHRNYRADAHAARLLLLILLARLANPHSMTVQLGWTWLINQTGKSRSWVAAAIAWAHEQGLLTTFEHGSTRNYRPIEYTLLHPNEANRQPIYILCLPNQAPPNARAETGNPVGTNGNVAKPVDETWTPTLKPKEIYKPPHARGSATEPCGPERSSQNKHLRSDLHTKHVRRRNLGQLITGSSLVLRKISPQHVTSVAKPWLEAGWTPVDIRHGLDHTPDGQLHPHTTQVHSPAGWMRHRLQAWCDPTTGAPLPSRSQLALARQHAQREHLARERAENQKLQAKAVTGQAFQRHLQTLRGIVAHVKTSQKPLVRIT